MTFQFNNDSKKVHKPKDHKMKNLNQDQLDEVEQRNKQHQMKKNNLQELNINPLAKNMTYDQAGNALSDDPPPPPPTLIDKIKNLGKKDMPPPPPSYVGSKQDKFGIESTKKAKMKLLMQQKMQEQQKMQAQQVTPGGPDAFTNVADNIELVNMIEENANQQSNEMNVNNNRPRGKTEAFKKQLDQNKKDNESMGNQIIEDMNKDMNNSFFDL